MVEKMLVNSPDFGEPAVPTTRAPQQSSKPNIEVRPPQAPQAYVPQIDMRSLNRSLSSSDSSVAETARYLRDRTSRKQAGQLESQYMETFEQSEGNKAYRRAEAAYQEAMTQYRQNPNDPYAHRNAAQAELAMQRAETERVRGSMQILAGMREQGNGNEYFEDFAGKIIQQNLTTTQDLTKSIDNARALAHNDIQLQQSIADQDYQNLGRFVAGVGTRDSNGRLQLSDQDHARISQYVQSHPSVANAPNQEEREQAGNLLAQQVLTALQGRANLPEESRGMSLSDRDAAEARADARSERAEARADRRMERQQQLGLEADETRRQRAREDSLNKPMNLNDATRIAADEMGLVIQNGNPFVGGTDAEGQTTYRPLTVEERNEFNA